MTITPPSSWVGGWVGGCCGSVSFVHLGAFSFRFWTTRSSWIFPQLWGRFWPRSLLSRHNLAEAKVDSFSPVRPSGYSIERLPALCSLVYRSESHSGILIVWLRSRSLYDSPGSY